MWLSWHLQKENNLAFMIWFTGKDKQPEMLACKLHLDDHELNQTEFQLNTCRLNSLQGLTLASDIGHLTDKICKCPIDVSYKRTNVLLICYKSGHCPIISLFTRTSCVCVCVCVCVFEILVWLQSCVYSTWITSCIVFCHSTKFSI